jgi:hypothetical protein
MANQAQFQLQVSDYTLSGIDRTNRSLRVKGNAIPIIPPGSLNTLTVVAGGSGWVVGDYFTIAGGGVGKVATVSSGAVATASVAYGASGLTAGTALAATAIFPSVGTGLTITTTVNAGKGGLLVITGFSIASSVVTFNLLSGSALTTGGGDAVVVQGFTGTYSFLNGLYTTASATATTFTASITAPNIGQTTTYATATLQPNYVSGGVGILNFWQFVDQIAGIRPIAGIGPKGAPNWIKFQTKNGSQLTYETSLVVPYPLVRVFSWASTAGEVAAGAFPADVIAFLAEFSAGGF